MRGKFRPSLKIGDFAVLGSWSITPLDPFSIYFHLRGHLRVSVCPSGPVPKGKGV